MRNPKDTFWYLFFINMAFRSILINKATKINLDLNNIVVYYEQQKYFINLDEINLIVIEDPRCLVSLKLLTKIGSMGITLIFVDESHMPVCAMESLFNNSRAAKRYRQQINWDLNCVNYLWTSIIKRKIILQKNNLIKINKMGKIDIINDYINTINDNDSTNREGLASRIYFKEFFGNSFKRFSEDMVNFSLNYIYQIIRAKIAQEIVKCGYNPCLGINHKSEYNSFNLADDFIEVYRPIVDYFIYEIIKEYDFDYLTPSIKEKLVNIVNEQVIYNNQKMKLHYSITLFVQNMFNFLETGDISKLIFPNLINECK